MTKEIDKIVEALRAAEMRQGCTDYHFYAEKLYKDLFPKPSTANGEAVAEKCYDGFYGAVPWAEVHQPLRDKMLKIADQILSLSSPEPKVLSEEAKKEGFDEGVKKLLNNISFNQIDIPDEVFQSAEAKRCGFTKRSFLKAGWRKVNDG